MNILSNTAIPTPRVVAGTFTEADWAEVLGHLADVIGLQAERYATIPAAKLIAAIGYLAGSEDPDRFAVSNLLTFHAATRARRLFNHRAADDHDVLRRLATIQFGTLADRRVVDYGMALLALISLGDHEHDQEADRVAGKYNPLNSGGWNFEKMNKEISETMAGNPDLRDLYSGVYDRQAPMNWWSI